MPKGVKETKKREGFKWFRVFEYLLCLFGMTLPFLYLLRNGSFPKEWAFYVFALASITEFVMLLLEKRGKTGTYVKRLKKISNVLFWFSLWVNLLQAILWWIVQFIKTIF